MRAPALCRAWIVACSSASAAPPQEGEPDRVVELRDRARAILARGGYQTELPEEPEPEERRSSGPAPKWLEPVAWVVVAAAALGALYAAIRVLAARRGAPKPVSKAVPAPPRPAPRAAALARADEAPPDPDALAAESRFAEAIHALWLLLLRELLRRPGAVVPGHTDRELVSLLATPSRDALRRIVELVERHRFAGLELGAPEWEESRRLFDALLPRRAA